MRSETTRVRSVALLLVTLLTAAVVGVAGLSAASAETGTPGGSDPETTAPAAPGDEPTGAPTDEPTSGPVGDPTGTPTGDPTGTPTGEPTGTPTGEPAGSFTVDDAMLRWGINNESNNRAPAPGTFNFFSAGKLANPGRGGQTLTDASKGLTWSSGRASGWKAASGNVRIEKLRPDGSAALATWAGLKTDRDGKTLGGYAVNTKFSDHQVVLRGGTGTVDPSTGDATVRWTGSFSVIYYSGMVFYHVSDPVLTVRNGVARLTATTSGYGTSREFEDWQPVPARAGIEIANLGTVDLADRRGFTARPVYQGVRVTGADQVISDEWSGSFPQPFIDFLTVVGSAPFYYSTGGSIDKNKVPLEVAVSYSASKPIIPTTPTPGSGGAAPGVTNTAPPPPSLVQQPGGPVIPDQPVAAGAPAGSDVRVDAVRPASTVLPLTPAAATSGPASNGPWIAGLVVLGVALLTATTPHLYARLRVR